VQQEGYHAVGGSRASRFVQQTLLGRLNVITSMREHFQIFVS
jgi:hypothetical protein